MSSEDYEHYGAGKETAEEKVVEQAGREYFGGCYMDDPPEFRFTVHW